MKKHYSYLLFDADDTLFDFKKAERYALLAVFEALQLHMDDAVFKAYAMIDRRYWEKYEQGNIGLDIVQEGRFDDLLKQYGHRGRISGKEFNILYQQELSRQICLNPGAEEICSILYEKYTLYIITNGIAKTQRSRVCNSSIGRYIREIITSEESGYQKPSIQFFHKVFERANCHDPLHYLIIGDSLYTDILGGQAAGIDCCWYNPNALSNTSNIFPTYTIDCLFQILELIGNFR